MSSLTRTIVSEFLQKARMRASGVMVSDLQNPARVWPVCHAVLCPAVALVSAGSQPLLPQTPPAQRGVRGETMQHSFPLQTAK